MTIWVDRLIRADGVARGVLIEHDADGIVTTTSEGADAPASGLRLDVAVPGFANAHSHAFHRALRGRTHTDGTFWSWRETMYAAAARLTPGGYRRLAAAVFGEMVAAGWTSVGEFHYVHHGSDGTPYPDSDMERALIDAALEAGIRLVLLDACYLVGGFGRPLSAEQRRFGDGTAARWLERWFALREVVDASGPRIRLGAAVHSVRAVPADGLRVIAEGLPRDVPLHVHLSEQPAENEDTQAAHGVTPTRLLADVGLLSERLSVVHATHLVDDDIALLAAAGTTAVLCPTTEADLGDGIGPARKLADAGVRIAIGSDQNAVVDPWLELRGLEAGERLRSGRRGRFMPAELLAAGSAGYAALGLPPPLSVGGSADLVELVAVSERSAGVRWEEAVMAITAADVRRTFVGGVDRSTASGERAHDLQIAIGQLWEMSVG